MHRFANPLRYQRIADAVLPWAGGLAAVLLPVGLWLALFIAPPDYQQGEAYRIMFVHVPAAWMALTVYAMMTVAQRERGRPAPSTVTSEFIGLCGRPQLSIGAMLLIHPCARPLRHRRRAAPRAGVGAQGSGLPFAVVRALQTSTSAASSPAARQITGGSRR
jgi:hypothetical protein